MSGDSAPERVRPDGPGDAATAHPRGPLDERVVLRHTGDAPTQQTIALTDDTGRAMTLAANSIADIPVQS